MMYLALMCLGSYLVGAIPFGVIVARLRGVDIMSVGSGNIGATNVWRTLGVSLGLLVFVLDVLKGAVPAIVAGWVTGRSDWAFLCGALAVLGHSASPFLRFSGGKGVSTGLGALLGSAPSVGLCAFGVFVVLLVVTRYVSLSSVVAAISMVVFGMVFHEPPIVIVGYGLLATFVVVRHRANLRRLVHHEEPRFRWPSGKSSNAGTKTQGLGGDAR
jgi:glycerol-3-phosphate acyltransferase PlsY